MFQKKLQKKNSFRSKRIRIPDTDDAVELFLVDCSGKENLYGEIMNNTNEDDKETKGVWNGAAMVVAVFDVCSQESFASVSKVKLYRRTEFTICDKYFNNRCLIHRTQP